MFARRFSRSFDFLYQIYEAMLTGPEAMPVFNDSTITPSEKRDIIAYEKEQTRSSPNPGGFSLGRIGPVTEGLVGWIGGIGALAPGRDLDHGEAAGARMSSTEGYPGHVHLASPGGSASPDLDGPRTG